jgi:hypothetical protein
MLFSKPPIPLAFFLTVLTLSFFQIFPQNNQPDQLAETPAVEPSLAQPILQVQTGRSEVLEAIVPLERITRKAFDRIAPSQPKPSDMLAVAEGLEIPPALQKFINEVTDGEAGIVRGVHVPDVLTLPVLQQPQKNPAYVSEENDTVTQFQSAAQFGVTGLLAHNYLSGELYYNIEVGQEVVIVMGDGATRKYQVTGIYRFKKLSPDSLRSNLIDLSDGKTLTTSQVFSRFYRGDHKVTFQTCLEGEGKLNWGLTFIVADPLDAKD